MTHILVSLLIWWCQKTLPACEYEDSEMCNWNAQTSGNGVGSSFTALKNGTIIYWRG